MNRRLALRVLAGGAVLAAAGFVVVGGDGGQAGAVDGVQHGYWWSAQPGTLPAPATVPKDGLWVSSSATGTQAISAVRFSLGPGESAPILTLGINSRTPVATGAVIACPTASAWAPGDAQSFAAKPAADCSTGSVGGVVSDDGTKMAFDLSLLPVATTYSVVLSPTATSLPVAVPKPPVPVPGPTAAPTIDVTFLPPEAAAVTVLTGVVPTAPPDTAAPTEPPSGSVSAPSPAVVPATTPRASTTITKRPATATPARRRATASVPLQRVAAHDDRTNRVLAALVFVALAGWAWRLSLPGGTMAPARSSIYRAAPAVPVGPDTGARRERPPTLR
ncbi:MAG: hypothetical protein JWO37_735 [Acidimicrobiales bacterium]|nr:hypothetical protein [Acidimicrobiales bacterium]